MAELLLDKAVIVASAAEVRMLCKRNLEQAAEAARALAASHMRFTDIAWSPVPFWFEVNDLRRGKEASNGGYVQHYDKAGRVVLIEQPGPRTHYRVYEHHAEHIDCLIGSVFKGQSHVSRVVRTHDGPRGREISTGSYDDVIALVWQREGHRITLLQQWHSSTDFVSTIQVQYDAAGTASALVRDGEVIWTPRPKRRRSDPIPKAATKILKAVRKQWHQVKEPVIALTVCYFDGHADELPPNIDLVFQRDADAYIAEPGKFGHDPWQFWSAGPDRSDPFLSPSSDDVRMEWTEEEMQQKLELLVDELNKQRRPEEPPYVLMDFQGAYDKHFSRIPDADRVRLARYLNV